MPENGHGASGAPWTLRRAPNDEATIIAPSNAVEHSAAKVDGAVCHEWRFRAGCPVEHVSAEVRENGDETRYRLRAAVADGWHLEKRSFPCVECPRVGEGGRTRWFMSGRASGGYGRGETCMWSNGYSAGQFAATWDDEEGVYFGVEDASDDNHLIGFREEAGGLVFSDEVSGWSSGEVATGYDVVVKKVRRGASPLVWSDFCDIYREWDERQPWSGKPLAPIGSNATSNGGGGPSATSPYLPRYGAGRRSARGIRRTSSRAILTTRRSRSASRS